MCLHAAAICPCRNPRVLLLLLAAGGSSAVLELGEGKGVMTGFTSWLAWRSAYLTKLGTLKHRMYVAGDWTLTLLFGRDTSRW